MIKRIQTYLRGWRAVVRPLEHDKIVRDVVAAQKRMTAARAHYDALMETTVWYEDLDKRIELAYHERAVAEEQYAYALALARGAGVRATWEDVIAG